MTTLNERKEISIIAQAGQYEQNHIIVKITYTTVRGLIRRLNQVSREHAVYGDNWAGWLSANIAVASKNDTTGDCNIIDGEWCDPSNGWLNLEGNEDITDIYTQLQHLNLIEKDGYRWVVK